jgi:ribosome-binding factor A
MHREFKRTDRVGSQIQRELATLVRKELKDPRLALVTIQDVEVVRDLSMATVYVTFMGMTDQHEGIHILNRAGGFLRTMLAKRMELRTIPELKFVYDESVERGRKLSSLIEQAVSKDTQ